MPALGRIPDPPDPRDHPLSAHLAALPALPGLTFDADDLYALAKQIDWGQRGNFWLPATYVDFNDFDCWTALDVVGDVA